MLSDAKRVQQLAGNFQVSKYLINMPYPYEEGMFETWFSEHAVHWESKTCVNFAICLSENVELIGGISVHDIKEEHGELGYWLGEEYWKQGFASEAVTKIIEYVMNDLNLERIYAEHDIANPASGYVMQKVCMTLIDTKKSKNRFDEEIEVLCYEIIKN